MFKILSPLDSPDEVRPLIEAGADELYCGVIPEGAAGLAAGVNRRTFSAAQLDDEAALADTLRLARQSSTPVHLTLNAPFYNPQIHEDLLGFAQKALDLGAAGFIVADPGLLLRLARRLPTALLTLSTMAGAMNHAAMAFYRDLGARRAVLPRHLGLDGMEALVKSAPAIEFEAFVLIGKCPNEEAYCTFQHVSPEKRWPCEIPYRLFDADTIRPAPPGSPHVAHMERWSEADRRMGCGLCGIGRLGGMGVKVLKLVGRGGPTRGKVRNVELVRKFAQLALGGNAVRSMAEDAYLDRFGRACAREVCYFPDLFPTCS